MADPPPPPLPPAPDVQPVTIPYGIIEKWITLRYDQYLDLKLARADFDNLYSAFDKSLEAQFALQECVILYTQGNSAVANNEMVRARRLLQESQNSFRLFFTAVMASAISNAK